MLTDVSSLPFSLEEECEAPLCTAALTAKNQELHSDMKRVTSVFEKLQSYINVLALPSKLALTLETSLEFFDCAQKCARQYNTVLF